MFTGTMLCFFGLLSVVRPAMSAPPSNGAHCTTDADCPRGLRCLPPGRSGSVKSQFKCQVPPPVVCMGACTNEFMGFRLCDGGGAGVCDVMQGRLEYNYCGWGTVCDDNWDDVGSMDANIACQMFGYSSGTAVTDAGFGEGTGYIWFDDVECVGTEGSIADCPHEVFGEENCSHDEDVGVICVP